jgi:ankyrin repeat protein
MTNPAPEAATLFSMTRNPIRRTGLVLLSLLLPLSAEDEKDLRELLRDALYTEEVTRDPEAAAKQYEALLSKHDSQRAFAAAALFRLAEVRRKQDRKDEAVALYQRLLREFPAAEAETKLARENLAALGKDAPAVEAVAADPETFEIERLKTLMANRPDTVMQSNALVQAVNNDRPRVVRYLLEAGTAPADAVGGLVYAASQGHLAIVKVYLEVAADRVKSGLPRALAEAVQYGNTQVAKALLDAGAPTDFQFTHFGGNFPDHAWNSGTPLMVAIYRSGNSTALVDLLLEAGAEVNVASKETGLTPLHFAARSIPSDPAAAPRWIERMIDAGADPNALSTGGLEQAPRPFNHALSPLQLAVIHESWESARTLIRRGADLKQPGLFDPLHAEELNDRSLAQIRFLLENGADANQPRLLGQLIDRGPDAIPLIQLLLESGCDPNAADPSGIPPIMRVFYWDLKNVENANERLAKHHKQVELIQLLLKHGADPNTSYGTYTRPATRGPGSFGSPGPFVAESEKSEQLPASVLIKVVRLKNEQQMNNVSLIQTLLDAGAKPTHEFPEVFDHVARGDEALPIAKALLPFRPATLELDRSGYFLNWNAAVKRLLLDEVLNPAVAAKGGVHLAFAVEGGYQLLVEAGSPIPTTAELLLANVASLTSRSGRYSGLHQEPVLTRVRREADGQWTREAIDWNGDAPLPELAAGDIIEMSEKSIPAEKSQDQAFTDQVAWQFRKRMSFPVTLEIGGKTREIRLRGDLLVFDPTRDEAPLLSAGHLAGLFLPLADHSGPLSLRPNTLLTVRRNGGPEVRMDLSARGAFDFPLQGGDQLVLPDSDSLFDPTRWSLAPVRLVVPDRGLVRSFGPWTDVRIEGKPSLTLPTLIQVLTDTYASRWPLAPNPEASTRFPEFSKRVQAGEIPVIPPHPDFSRIRIRRNDETLEIDLTAAIQRCTDDTPDAEVRQADVPLHPGDVVELPQKSGSLDQAWTGFTKEEERFFRKALGGVVMVRKQDGIIEPVEISYQQAAWQPTPHGLLPLTSASGVVSSRLRPLTGMDARGLRLKRDGHEFTIASPDAFVRDGDEIMIEFRFLPSPTTPSGSPQPRPRVQSPEPSPSSRPPRRRVEAPATTPGR